MAVGRIHFRMIVLAWVVSASVTALGQSNPPAAAPPPLIMVYPKGWADAKDPGSVLAARAPLPDNDQTGQFQASLVVSQRPGAEINAGAQERLIAQQFAGYRQTDPPTACTLNGIKGIYFGGTFTHNNTLLHTRLYMFSADNQLYVVTFTSLASQWPVYLPAVEGSINTIALKK